MDPSSVIQLFQHPLLERQLSHHCFGTFAENQFSIMDVDLSLDAMFYSTIVLVCLKTHTTLLQ
jgi:hypothetical protein